MDKKHGWTYIQSESLCQLVAVHNATGWAYCEDGTRYSPDELRRMRAAHRTGEHMPPLVHEAKRLFTGEIVSVERLVPFGEKKHVQKKRD